MATVVYILSAATSLACALLLLRSYRQRRVRLLLWSGVCFIGFALNNLLLIIDTEIVPETDLSIIRTMPTLIGVFLLVYALVWDAN